MSGDENKDGCSLDFAKNPTKDADVEALLVPAGEEEDEEDA